MSKLITEAEVRAAVKTGTLVVPSDALVTPAARDLAKSLGVAMTTARDSVERTQPGDARTGTVVLGADHGGFALKEALKPWVAELGFSPLDVGTHSTEPVDYPVFAARVADTVADGRARFGIMVDGAGLGSSMVANKIAGIRAALCYDITTANNAREHNNANVLTLGGTLLGERLAREIVREFLTTPFGGGRHQRRVAMIDALDRDREPHENQRSTAE